MSIIQTLEKRRSIYNINKELPVPEDTVINTIQKVTELVPDAFNMKSSQVMIVLGEKHDILWDTVYDVFEGKVPIEKIQGFRNGAGTVLYFYDEAVVRNLQGSFPKYADNFPVWANQASAMLQINIWGALRELGIGANLQHYNPVINTKVRELFQIPESYILVAQMPFGGIVEEPAPKEKEDIKVRVQTIK
ncbi:nitroreductase family protein [Luxibacter massiliensis]|uniref:nitroreductase family protein n=1 Tax=Luxibacter massiliensis TaxID=2219695 RepID=UPI000F048BFE|nr:nitroreductase family protein [Luxibacter massiliensis]